MKSLGGRSLKQKISVKPEGTTEKEWLEYLAEPPMTNAELLDEVMFLTSFGVHPVNIARQLNMSATAIHQAATRANNQYVIDKFDALVYDRRSNSKKGEWA